MLQSTMDVRTHAPQFYRAIEKAMNKVSSVFVLIMAICMLPFSSCKKNKYSCDDGLNEWATTTRTTNQNITRDQLAAYGLDSQQAIFASLSNENKYRIYQEKIQLVLSTGSFSAAERTHLQSAIDYMKPEYYDAVDESAFDAYFDQWKATASDKFKWDGETMFFMLETWLTKAEISGMISGGEPSGGSSGKSCTCIRDWYCGAWAGHRCKTNTGCTADKRTCGIFSKRACEGRCDWEHEM